MNVISVIGEDFPEKYIHVYNLEPYREILTTSDACFYLRNSQGNYSLISLCYLYLSNMYIVTFHKLYLLLYK